MFFIGIDLAWSDRNKTGVTILKGDRKKAEILSYSNLLSDKELIDYIKSNVGNEGAIAAIDAPLIVLNRKGRRIAEKIVGSLFRKYDAGAHPSNRTRFKQWSGRVRGEDISKILENDGFIHSPYIKRFENARKFFEVYPHPSMVVLFNLEKILKYKSKPNREQRLIFEEFRRYQKYLKGLEQKEPSLFLTKDILEKKVKTLGRKMLKDYEDTLDSIFCAYLAYYHWHSPDKCAVLGNMKQGYISTPVFDFMRDQLRSFNFPKS